MYTRFCREFSEAPDQSAKQFKERAATEAVQQVRREEASRGWHSDESTALDLRILLAVPERAKEMRKRSKYRPRQQLANPVQWVLSGFQPMRENEHAVSLKIKNHQAMFDMTAGEANRDTVDVLIAAMNMAEALATVNPEKLGGHLGKEIRAAQDALHAMGKRSLAKGVFRFTGPELVAMNIGMDIHDQQLDTCNIAELDEAVQIVAKAIRHKKARAIA